MNKVQRTRQVVSAVAAVSATLMASATARAAIQINEVMVDAFGTNATQDFIELRSTTGGVESLNDLTMVLIEGDAGAALGTGSIDHIVSFAGQSTGTNGLFLRHSFSAGPSPAPAPETSVQVAGWGHENLAITYLLVSGFTGATGTDLDMDNDGTFDQPLPWTSVVDAFAVLDGNVVGDQVYAAQFGGPVLNQAVQGTVPRAVFRAQDGIFHGVHQGDGTPTDPIGGPYVVDDSDTVELDYVLSPGNVNNPVNTNSQAWLGAGGTDWNTAANWSRGTVPNAVDDVAMFVPTGGSPVNVASDVTVGKMLFYGGDQSLTGSGAITLDTSTGNALIGAAYGDISIATPLVLNDPTDMSVPRAQTLTISGSISGPGNLRKLDAGFMTLTGANTYSGGSLINTGTLLLTGAGSLGTGDAILNSTLRVENNNVLPGIDGPGSITIGDGLSGVTVAAKRVRLATVTINDNSTLVMTPNGGLDGVSSIATLNLLLNAKIDLKDNKLIIPVAGVTGTWTGSGYDGFASYVDQARGDAGNALWDGPSGITTSDTRAINNGDLVSIGVAKVGDVRTVADTETTTFAGQTVLGSDTLIMATWGGDANLDGKINIDDYGRIDGNVGQSGTVFGWSKGDFNYDGKINIDDYGIIDGNINRQGTPFVTSGSAAGVEGVAAVPEPASLSLLALAGLRLIRRRRRMN